MIYYNPPNAVLGDAEVVTLFDLNVPGWKEVVVSRKAGITPAPGVLSTINIPVDSTDSGLLGRWRERISRARG